MESQLTLQYKQLAGEVGEFLGYGRGPDNDADSVWTKAQKSDIDFCVASGLRQFYFPAPTQGYASYDWTFLKPVASIPLAAAATSVNLPDDFGGFEGPLTIRSASTSQPWAIQWRNEAQIRSMYAVTPTATGAPMYGAESPIKGTTVQGANRWQLIVFPAADQAYTLQATYYIAPDFLSGAQPYAYGGVDHSETLLESCLAIAEQRRDDTIGIHTEKFAARLLASIHMDSRHRPQLLGLNKDRSDEKNGQNRHWAAPAATYNGGTFD